jgi:Sel1 repeat
LVSVAAALAAHGSACIGSALGLEYDRVQTETAVMPDSTFPPGEPAVLRDVYRRVSEPGTGAWRRTTPGRAAVAAAGDARARFPADGPIARAERVETRWRDIQWVDFDGLSVDAAVAELEPPRPKSFWAVEVGFDRAGTPSPIPPRTNGHAASDLLPRAIRLSPEPAPQPAPAAASPVPRFIGFDPESKPEPAPAPKPRPAFSVVTEMPFPAAIETPVSTGSAPREPLLYGQLRPALSARLAGAGIALRGASYAAAATATSGLARAKTVLRPLPVLGRRAVLPSGSFASLSRHLARSRNRRMLGLAALAAIVIALAAYGGHLMLPKLTDGATTSDGTASGDIPDVAAKQPVAADKLARSAPATTGSATLSSSGDAAARAASYLVRAKAGDSAAQYDVGVFYARGDGLVQDYASAASWFHAAAAQGNVAAQYNLGVLYAQGLGVTKDKAAALNWYRSAADQNHPAAQFNLALAYAAGSGIKQDFATAARWYQRAAEQGFVAAMVNLAILYEQGNGVDHSPVDAYAWYSVAGERGDNGAKERAAGLFQQFNDKDKARAQGLAATIGAALDAAAPQS